MMTFSTFNIKLIGKSRIKLKSFKLWYYYFVESTENNNNNNNKFVIELTLNKSLR